MSKRSSRWFLFTLLVASSAAARLGAQTAPTEVVLLTEVGSRGGKTPILTLIDGNSAIAGGTEIPATDTRLVFTHSTMVPAGTVAPDTTYLKSQTGYVSPEFSLEFLYIGTSLEFIVKGRTSAYRVQVNGSYVNPNFGGANAPVIPNNGNREFLRLTLPYHAISRIRFEGNDVFFGGLVIEPGATVIPVTTQKPKALFLGDSVTAPTSGTAPYVNTIADYFGWEVTNSAWGDTGYLNTGGDKLNYGGRIETDVCPIKPDLVVFTCGQNDQQWDAGSISSEVSTDITKVRGCTPQSFVTTVGPFPTGTPATPSLLQTRDAILVANRQLGVPTIDPLAQNWVTGDYKTPASGNASQLVGSDEIHLTPAGAENFGAHMIANLSRVLPAAPLPATITLQYGQSLKLKAHIFSIAGVPHGEVTLTDLDSGRSWTAQIDQTGLAIADLSMPSVGNHHYVARYPGWETFGASESAQIPVTVNVVGPTVTLVGPDKVAADQQNTFTVYVRDASGASAPTGWVGFYDGERILSSVELSTQAQYGEDTLEGAAGVGLSLPPGTHKITARYRGDQSYAAANSASLITTAVSPPIGVVDPVPSTIKSGSPFVISGWATEGNSNKAVKSIDVQFGNIYGEIFTYSGRVGLVRADKGGLPIGWSVGLDTTRLKIGKYTVHVVAKGELGGTTSLNIPGGVNSSFEFTITATPPIGVIETSPVTVNAKGNITVSGWAMDSAGEVVPSIQIYIDDYYISAGRAIVAIPRPDFGGKLFGWQFAGTVSGLRAGTHSIRAVATDSRLASSTLNFYRTATQTFTVVDTPPTGVIEYSLPRVRYGEEFFAGGWAADKEDGLVTRQIEVLVDGNVIFDGDRVYRAITTGISRPDFAGARVGWKFRYLTSMLGVGTHTLEVRAIDLNGVKTILPFKSPASGTFTVVP